LTRLAVLLGSTAAFLGVLLLLNWWVDPFSDHYRAQAVASALRHKPRCDVSTEVLQDSTWPAYKIDLFRRRQGRTIVVGTSRIWKMGARAGESHFVNESLPGMAADSIPILFRRLGELTHGRRLTVFLNIDPFWFTDVQRSSSFARLSLYARVKELGSAETLRATLAELRSDPLDLVNPPSRQNPTVSSSHRGCLLDEEHAVARLGANAWAPDGTFVYNYELTGVVPGREDFLSGPEGAAMRGSHLDPEPIQRIQEALAFAKTRGWRLVGFSAPLSPGTITRVRQDPAGAALLRVFRREIPPLFSAQGFPFVNLLEGAARVSCTDDDYLRHDGAHMNTACANRVRIVLERAELRTR
jgi:hypothetical protein